jgi:hypothetical protein
MKASFSTVISAFLIGLGLALAGYFVSQTTLNQRIGANTARVKGLSERIVPANTATWTLNMSVTSRDFGNVAGVFDTAENNQKRINEILTKAGFSDAEINFSPLRKNDFTNRNNNGDIIDQYYSVGGTIIITTSKPAKIAPARKPIFALAREGIDIKEYDIAYRFTKLNDIKPAMLREATENARIAANEFAQNAGVSVGGIQNATQGGFQVLGAGNAGPDANDINKLVRVVTTITFYLEN